MLGLVWMRRPAALVGLVEMGRLVAMAGFAVWSLVRLVPGVDGAGVGSCGAIVGGAGVLRVTPKMRCF